MIIRNKAKKIQCKRISPGKIVARHLNQRLYILRNRDRKRHIKFQFPRKPMRVVKINFCGEGVCVKETGA